MPSLVTEELLDAIAMAESSGGKNLLGDTALKNKAYGTFQLRLPAYQDVQRLYPKEFGQVPFERVQQDQRLNRQAARRYLEALEGPYGIKEFDRMVAAYNAGPTAIRKSQTIPNPQYVQKVKRYLNQKGGTMPKTPGPQSALPSGDPIERGVRHVNQMATAFGLQPLNVQEIEGLLEQHAPRTPINGLKPEEPTVRVPKGLAMGGEMDLGGLV